VRASRFSGRAARGPSKEAREVVLTSRDLSEVSGVKLPKYLADKLGLNYEAIQTIDRFAGGLQHRLRQLSVVISSRQETPYKLTLPL
jgi:hypothetical protein